VARPFEVNPNVLHRWRREFRRGPGNAFPGLGKRRWEEGRTAQLKRKIGHRQPGLIVEPGEVEVQSKRSEPQVRS
jgi:transposase-like protein